MYTFGTISVYGLVANLFAVPLVPLAMFLSLATVVASYASEVLALAFGYLDSFVANIIIFIAESVEALPFSHAQITISFWMMCALYTLLPTIVVYLAKKNETFQTTEEGYTTGVIAY